MSLPTLTDKRNEKSQQRTMASRQYFAALRTAASRAVVANLKNDTNTR